MKSDTVPNIQNISVRREQSRKIRQRSRQMQGRGADLHTMLNLQSTKISVYTIRKHELKHKYIIRGD